MLRFSPKVVVYQLTSNTGRQTVPAPTGYTYNSIGNLMTKCGAAFTYGYGMHPSAVSAISGSPGKTYEYDANGNMTRRDTQTLAWSRGLMIGVKRDICHSTPLEWDSESFLSRMRPSVRLLECEDAMIMQKTGKVEVETASPEKVSAVQEISAESLTPARTTLNPMEQHTSIHSIAPAFDIVDHLQGVVFCRPEGKHDISGGAEDLAEVVRGAVAHGEGGNAKTVDYARLMAVLIEAVKEQQLQMKEQERSLKEQKAQVARVKADIERIKISIRARTG